MYGDALKLVGILHRAENTSGPQLFQSRVHSGDPRSILAENRTPVEAAGSGRIPVAVAVVIENGKLLIAHRFPDPHLPDLWEFPGGKIEPGEEPAACAIREVAEELGIEIEILGLLMRRPYDYADRRVDLWFFVARRTSGRPEPRGCQEWRWVDPDDLASYPLPDGDEPVLAALRMGVWIPPAVVKEGEVLARRYLAPEAIELVVRPLVTEDRRFHAGQHLMVEVGDEEFRAYSIASPPGSQVMELCIKRLPKGPGSDYIASRAAGDRIRYTGPQGSFTVRLDIPRDRLFIATGTGVAPFRSMIRDLLERGIGGESALLFGARTEQDLLYFEEFRALERYFPVFKYYPCLSRPSNRDDRVLQGRVTTLLPGMIEKVRNRDVYLCGSGEMIHDSIVILSHLGFDPARCFTEAWY